MGDSDGKGAFRQKTKKFPSGNLKGRVSWTKVCPGWEWGNQDQ